MKLLYALVQFCVATCHRAGTRLLPAVLFAALICASGQLRAQCPAGNVLYVDAAASGLNNGTSWSNAFTNLQDALDANCPGVSQIWVAAGTYIPGETGGTSHARDKSFWLRNNLAIYGGFEGNETSLDGRDWKENVTLLSGDLSGNDGPDFSNYDENAYHVVNTSGLNRTARLDGFTITRGNADVSGMAYTNSGGGIYNLNGHPTLANLRIVGNKAGGSGGGMYNRGDAIFTNVIFTGNRAGTDGAGMTNLAGDPVLINVVFSGNRAGITGNGGGIYNFGPTDDAGRLTLINVTFTGNNGGLNGGGIYNGFNGSATLTNVIIWDNLANNNGTSPSSSIYYGAGSDPGETSIDHSLIANSGGSGSGWNGDLGQDGGNNIDANPGFSSTAHPVLISGSPAVNAGTNGPFGDGGAAEGVTTDPDGNSRIAVAVVDMGAYESPFAPAGPGADGVLYVNINVNTSAADYNGTGNSWSNALPQLSDALQWAHDNWDDESGTLQIWVAQGTYTPTGGSREAAFRLKSDVAVYGGFAGTEASLEERDWEANLTVLSGDLDGDDDEQFENNNDNSYHVLTGSGTDNTARLDGFNISGGNANNAPSGNTSGGGMYNVSGSPTLVNILFQGNNADENGGAMYNYGRGPTLINVVFSGNSAGGNGGAIYNDSCNPSLINTSLSGNSAGGEGGAIYNTQSFPILTNVIIWNNSADGDTGSYSSSIYNSFPSKAEISYSLVANSGGSGDDWDTDIGDDNGNNIDANPLFINPIDPTAAPQGGGDLRLQAGTPAANMGLLTPFGIGEAAEGIVTDLGGNPRVSYELVDMGAYESSFAPTGPGEGNILYVDKDVDITATDYDGSGNSWTNAMPQLSDALVWARDHWNGEEGALQVWVAAGTYLPTSDPTDRSASFILSNHVSVYGGFTGDETSLDDREPTGNLTVLSGDLLGDDGSSPDSRYENSYHVVVASEVDKTARMDGFTISGGYASQSLTVFSGGGMVNEYASPVLVNLHFAGNYAKINGGGMYNLDESHPTLINVIFSGNSAGYSGGGMCNIEESHATLINVTFSGNSAGEEGGAIFNLHSNPTLTNVIIWNNSAGFGADATTSSLEASIFNIDDSTPSVSHSLIANSGGSGDDWIPEIGQDNGGNIDEDPLFASPPDPAAAPTTAGDLRLKRTSPATNTGNNTPFDPGEPGEGITTDPDGHPRIAHSAVDMGAYENPLIPIAPGDGNILYVNIGIDTEAPGYNGSGNSWSNALPQLYDALDWAHANWEDSEGTLEIWVAGGTYLPVTPADPANVGFGERDISFVMKNNVALYGGFAGMETSLDERDWKTNVTILSGDLLGDDGDDFANNDENAYHVVTGSGTNATARLDGFTVSGGNANESNDNNNGGGGIMNETGSPTLVNISFTNNSASTGGGGLRNNNHSSPVLINVSFSGNMSAFYGGGMHNQNNSSPTLTNVSFSGNNSKNNGGGLINYNKSSPTLINVSFSGNNSGRNGGGMFNYLSSPTLINVSFSGNNSENNGGGLMNLGSSPTLINVSFSGNNSENNGGGMMNMGSSSPTLTNVVIWNNSAAGNTESISASIANENPANVVISHSLIANSRYNNGNWINGIGTDGGGNIEVDPRFAVPVDPADTPITEGDLRLLPGSPAINAGKNEPFNTGGLAENVDTDPNSAPRISHEIVDMGAYESSFPPVEPDDNNILYVNIGVDMTATDYDGSGSSWANALPQLSEALVWAHENWDAADGTLQIWVARGTYKPTSGDDRTVSFVMKDNVVLYGGFAGTEAALDERDWVANLTILSGDIGTPDDLSDNSYHVIFNNDNSVSADAMLNGFMITGGNANASASPHNAGGGMFNSHVSPTIVNCVFSGNSSNAGGGGMYNTFESAPLLVNCLISGNSGTSPSISNGGGIRNNNAHPTLINCTIAGNASPFGGGMGNLGASNPKIINSIIYGNSSGISTTTASNPEFSYSLVQGFTASGTGNLGDVDPLFVAPVDHGTAPTTEGDYSLQAKSPAVNAGTNEPFNPGGLAEGVVADLDNRPRIRGGVDMGPYESSFAYIKPGPDNILYVNVHVDTLTAGYNYPGSSWATALPQLSEALEWAHDHWDGTEGTLQVWVAQGTYLPTSNPVNRDATFLIKNNVAIYGGFAGTETTLDDRDWVTHPTILSGDLEGNDGDDFENNDENIYTVVTGSGTDHTARLDGFTISGGNSDPHPLSDYVGGGMHNENGSPTLSNLVFTGNYASKGGAMTNRDGSTPLLLNVSFIGNTAVTHGGGIYNQRSSPTLINVTISGNSADIEGGGIYNESNSSPSLINLNLSGNSVGGFGGGIFNSESSPILTNVIIWNNSADGNTTSVSASIYNYGLSLPTISHSLIANSGGSGIGWVGTIGTDGGGNIDIDPRFADAPNPADAPSTAGDLRLLPGSPAINIGTNAPFNTGGAAEGISTDLDGNPRLIDDVVDIGAYESQPHCPDITIVSTLTEGKVGILYDAVLNATSGTAPYRWTLIDGDLPEGILLDEAGKLTGTPFQAGSFEFSLKAEDDSDCSAIQNFVLNIQKGEAPAITFPSLAEAVYGDSDMDPGASTSNGATIEYSSSNTAVAGITADGLIRILGAGTAAITAHLPSDPNYENAVDQISQLTVHPAVLTVTANDDTKTYNGTPYIGGNGVTVSGWVYSDTDALLTGALIYGGDSQSAINAGAYAIEPSGYEPLDNYTFDYQAGVLTIGKAPLTITTENKARLFGQANPTFTFVYEGFVTGDDETGLTSMPVAATDANETSLPGTYPITVSGAASPNYEITYENGTLTIAPAGSLLVFGTLPEKTYGDPDFDPGAISGDDREAVYVSSNPAVARITADGLIQLLGAGSTNITASLPPESGYKDAEPIVQELVVNKAVLTIAANNDSKIYDGTPYSGGRGVTVTNWQYADSETLLEGTLTYSGSSQAATSAGEYQIIPSGYDPLDNYMIDYLPGMLRIEKSPLLITVEDKARIFGQSNPLFTFRYEGFVTGDDETGLTSMPMAETGANEASPPDNYPITVSGAASPNYEIAYQAGTLTVMPLGTTLVFGPLPAKIYGDDAFDPGAVSSDDREVAYSSSNTAVAEITTDGQIQILGAGSTNITASLPPESGYKDAEPIVQELVVNKAVLTITANNDSKIYDGTPYSGGNGVTVTGWKYAEKEALLEGTLTYSGISQGAVNAGEYLITPEGYFADNYEITYESGELRIGKATLVITAVDKARKYGQVNPSFSFSYEGFVTGENETDLASLPAGATTATGTAPPGVYPISVSSASSPNYDIQYVQGALTVLPATRSLAFEPLPEKTYGDDDFDPDAEVNTDEAVIYTSSNVNVAAIVDGMIHITGAGTATITATLPENPNYKNIPSISRELIVHKAPQTIDFAEIGDMERDAGIISLEVSASSGLPVVLSSSDLQVAAVAGENQLEVLRLGTSTITATQAGNANYLPAAPVSHQLKVVDPAGKVVKVHPAVSPNGDGMNEFLLIEGIRDYPENRITIVNRNGVNVFEVSGYDNGSRSFKGLANTVTSYDFLPQGTYFYLLEIKAGSEWIRETGWFVMKYSAN